MRVLLLTLLLALGAARAAGAGALEALVMPGPVAAAHAEIETDCGRCHVPFQQQAQKGLCLACHEEVAADQHAGARFHGLHPAAANADCRTCHGEHRGREADLLGLDREAFDHAATAFALEGGHAGAGCDACHAAGRPFRAAPTACVDCHASGDPHRGGLGKDCADCHAVTAWLPARFDHGTTRFPLIGRHADARCGLCHTGERYADTPQECSACHRLDDAHQGRLGDACADCHRPDGWSETRFDHDRDTRFPLRGGHAAATCDACHGPGPPQAVATDCLSCHRGDDVHRGRHGPRCDDCHGEAGWIPARFDHGARTAFPLTGAHARIACDACHTEARGETEPDTSCFACHEADDAHRGQQGRACETCHESAGWRERVRFDHDLARFPLLGMHAAVGCEECHTSAAHRDAEETCAACHRGDDPHGARLGDDCARCHNPNAWTLSRFDHARDARLPLAGAHADLRCEGCHTRPAPGGTPAPLERGCVLCHAGDDPHGGALGRDCGRCHGERVWREVSIRR